MPCRKSLRSGFAVLAAAVAFGPGEAAAREWVRCAVEGEYCSFSGTKIMRYGAEGDFRYQVHSDGIPCANNIFGDPLSGARKICWIYVTDAEVSDRQRLEQLREMRAQLQQRDQRIAELETRVAELRERVQRVRGGTAGDDEELQQAREKASEMRSRMQEKNERIRDLAQRVKVLQARLEELE